MPQDFVVFCEARTGSYSLVSRLNSCPDIICHGEIFKQTSIEVSRFHSAQSAFKTVGARNTDPVGFIADLRAINPREHFGFKLFSHHLNWAPGAVAYLKAPEVRKVVLHRDPREIYASSLRARSTGVWIQRKVREFRRETNDVKVSYTPESFGPFAAHYNKFTMMAHLVAGLPNSFVIHYDQINDVGALTALFAFLGSRAEVAESSTDFEKQYKGGLQDGFENWEAFAARLAEGPALLAGPPASYKP